MVGVIKESPGQSTIMGLPVHLLQDYSGWLLTQLRQQQGVHVVTLNAEMAIQADQNELLAAVIRRAELVIPDGAGVVLYLRFRGKRVQRCPGIELAEAMLRQVAGLDRSYPIFFYGGKPGVGQAAAACWQQQYGLTIATQHGYLASDEQQQLCRTLHQQQPRLILVGLGVPRQEFWIAEHRHLCPNAIWIGVGGSFDIWSGSKSRAPDWFCDNHLEWVYRLYQEPWRWRRMLALPKFVWRALVADRYGSQV